MRTKAEIIPTEQLDALDRQVFGGACAGCGAILATEGDFARHFLIPDERYLNLGLCPKRAAGVATVEQELAGLVTSDELRQHFEITWRDASDGVSIVAQRGWFASAATAGEHADRMGVELAGTYSTPFPVLAITRLDLPESPPAPASSNGGQS